MAVQFTEAEMLILTSLTYTNDVPKGRYDEHGFPVAEPVELTQLDIRGLALRGCEKEKFASEDDYQTYLDTAASLEKKLKENNFVISRYVDQNDSNESGFMAFAIEPVPNPEKEAYVISRGSDLMDGSFMQSINPLNEDNTLNDWWSADAALAWSEQTRQQQEMQVFMEGLAKYDSITLAGHSLGGNLAVYGAVSYPNHEKIKNVYSFNGPGFNPKFHTENLTAIKDLEGRIWNFQNENDMVSSMLIDVGKVVILESALTEDNIITNHSLWTCAMDPDGTVRRGASGKKYIWTEAIGAVSNVISVGIKIGEFVLNLQRSGIVINVLKYVQEKIRKAQVVKGVTTQGSLIKVDPNAFDGYAKRLVKVNQKLRDLDRRMDALYSQVGLLDLWNLMHADLLTAHSWRIDKNIEYLRAVKNEFEAAERAVAQSV